MTRKHIAIVDDNMETLSTLQRLFGRLENVTVTTFSNPLKAIEDAKKGEFDVILLDIVMPELNGLHFLEKVRYYNSETKIFIMTSEATLDRTLEAHRQEADDFLTKPFKSLEELTKKVLNA
jgi:DNA-binding NtrC family response regulator